MSNDMKKTQELLRDFEYSISAFADRIKESGAYMPAFATRLRLLADVYADEFPDNTNGGGMSQ